MKVLHFIPLVFLLPFYSFSQDDHPWAQQYGATSTLLGGAVVGGVRDNSAIYYNPGALPLIDNNSISVDANVYKVDRVMIHNGAGSGVNLNSTQVCIYPQIISGTIDLFKVKNLRFAYALLTRNYNNMLMNSRYTSSDFDIDPYSGLTDFVGAFDYNNQLTEQWFCLGAGYQLNDHMGVGLTMIGLYRAQTYQLTNYVREVTRVDSTYWFSTLNSDEAVKYKSAGVMFKAGIAWQGGGWRMGLSVTTPSFQVYGRGDILREFSVYGISENPQDTGFSFIILDKKSSVHSLYRHPWSVAGGVEYQFPKTRLSISAEWFLPVKSYTLIGPESTPFVYPPEIKDSVEAEGLTKDFLKVSNSSRGILNIGVGLEQELGKCFYLLLGANTDFSTYKTSQSEDVLLHSAGGWDLYHIAAGLAYQTEKQTITLGFRYSFSPSRSIAPYTQINPVQANIVQAKVWAQSFALIIGYTHFLQKKNQ
jgi:hypothetical protein